MNLQDYNRAHENRTMLEKVRADLLTIKHYIEKNNGIWSYNWNYIDQLNILRIKKEQGEDLAEARVRLEEMEKDLQYQFSEI